MQVILLKDVAGIGQKGAVKNVSDGYATNYLIPHRFAEAATHEKMQELKKKQAADADHKKRLDALWKEYALRLKDAHITLRMEANEQGQLYRQVPAAAIVERLSTELGVVIREEAIVIKEAIRHVGRSRVAIRLGSHETDITLIVERE